MIKIALHDTLNIKIHSDDYKILNSLKKELSLYAKDYQFSPLYKLNRWDGKISLMKADNTIPYGLVNEVLRFFIKYYPNEKLTVEDEVKDLFHGTDLEPTFNLLFDPYYYQEKIVRTALKTSCGFFRVSVASGKSYCIANISKNLLDMGLINKQLIVVPTLSLIKQFYNDLIEYGIDESWLGVVNKDKKEFDNKIVISTWQSLKVRKEEYQQFQSIIVDEAQGTRARVMYEILANCYNANWRFGFTGTLPSLKLQSLQCQSYIGPVLEEYSSDQLAKEGYISTIKVKKINISYKQKFNGEYKDIKDAVMDNDYRNKIICQTCNSIDDSILILIREINEGQRIVDALEDHNFKNDKEIVFLSGKDKDTVREYWRNKMNEKKNIIMIATYGIFYVGVNIKSLRYVMLGSPLKSKIVVLQSIGRAMRKDDSKENNESYIIDICDKSKYLIAHAKQRQKYYSMEGFEVEETVLKEPEPLPINF